MGGFIFPPLLLYNEPMTKLYCYVDETGQDTGGKIFIVSVVVTENGRDELLKLLEVFEKKSGKGNRKWHKSKHPARVEYLRQVLRHGQFRGRLRYSVFRNVGDYDMATVVAIAKGINVRKPRGKYTTIIYVDALRKPKRHEYGRELRKLGIPTRKVQGVARDESNALIRLADAIAGFVRDVVRGEADQEMKALFERAKRRGVLIEV